MVLAAPAAEAGALELRHGGDGGGSEWLALVGPGGREVARRAVPPGSAVLRARWRRGRREVRVTLGAPGGAAGDDGGGGVGGGPAEGEGSPVGTAAVALREVSNEKGRSLVAAEDAPAGSLLLEEEPVSAGARPPTSLSAVREGNLTTDSARARARSSSRWSTTSTAAGCATSASRPSPARRCRAPAAASCATARSCAWRRTCTATAASAGRSGP